MENEAMRALKWAGGMLLAALLLHNSIFGFLLALGAAVPAGYALWLGSQQEGQKTYGYALLVFLGSLGLALLLFLGWLF